ncbi:MAG: cyclic nucleotide-binding domain-containing protein [Gammaproteobacteria bacterium]|jgi:CRP-like cAMP-binding protein|nr:cyclic nucleotide-binding domain-containing protein [Gammaproteobacteria bacterium]
MASLELLDTLRRIPLFASLDDGELTPVAHAVHRHRLQRGEILFQKGDPALGFYYLVQGQVKLALLAPDGHEKVIELLGEGMTFGEAVMFIDRPYPAYAEVLRDSELLFIPRTPLLDAIQSNPALALKLLAGLSVRLHGMVREIEALSTRNSTQRVIGYLLADRGDEDPDTLSLPASKALIASQLNLTPETFSRVLHDLQERGLISVDRRTIHLLDRGALAGQELPG